MVDRGRSAIRSAVVWEALLAAIEQRRSALEDVASAGGQDGSGRPLRVVDLGGGTGGLAVWIAEHGHQVTVVDPSPDALASLGRRAAEGGVTATVRGVLGDANTLLDVVEPGTADVVICHEVLEVVDEPAQALAAAAAALAAGGSLSVLVAQRSAAVVGRALAGQFGAAKALLGNPVDQAEPTDAVGPRRFNREEIRALLNAAGFVVAEMRGVRVFTDHVDSAVVNQPGAAETLADLESAVATHPDFIPLATQLHLLALRGDQPVTDVQ